MRSKILWMIFSKLRGKKVNLNFKKIIRNTQPGFLRRRFSFIIVAPIAIIWMFGCFFAKDFYGWPEWKMYLIAIFPMFIALIIQYMIYGRWIKQREQVESFEICQAGVVCAPQLVMHDSDEQGGEFAVSRDVFCVRFLLRDRKIPWQKLVFKDERTALSYAQKCLDRGMIVYFRSKDRDVKSVLEFRMKASHIETLVAGKDYWYAVEGY